MDILLNPFVIGILACIIVFGVLTYLDNQNDDEEKDIGKNKENIILVSGIVAFLVGFIKYYFFRETTNVDVPIDSIEIISKPLDLPKSKIPEVFFKVDK